MGVESPFNSGLAMSAVEAGCVTIQLCGGSDRVEKVGLIVCPKHPFGAETPGAKQTKALTQVFVEPNLVFAV